METLAARGAILLDHHFVYKSGTHGPNYINVDPIFPAVSLVADICKELGEGFEGQVDTVTGAATGGIPLSVLTAYLLGIDQYDRKPDATWADKDGDDFVYARAGFTSRLAGRRVLVVEDLLNTGDSVKKVIAQARRHGAEIVGVSVICNRGPETAESLDVPRLKELSKVDFRVYDAATCPLCASNVPIVADIGHGAKFRGANPGYEGGYVELLAA